MPSHMQNSLIFHYNLKFYGDDTDNYDGISLKRFVMQVNSINMRAMVSLVCIVDCLGTVFLQPKSGGS